MTRIFPMPSFTDPHDPAAAGGSINFGTAENFPEAEGHPTEHSPDYAGGRFARVEREQVDGGRDEWNKDRWEDLAEEYGLSKSGTKQEIIDRVEEYEASLDSQREVS